MNAPVSCEPIAVTGIGLITALGKDTQTTWKNLIAGRSGLRVQQPFSSLLPLELGIIDSRPALLDSVLKSAVQSAVEDAHLTDIADGLGIAIGSSRGCQHQLEAIARNSTYLDQWLSAYSQSPGQTVAQMLSIQGPILSPRAACATGLWAIAQGAELIRTGQCHVAIAGAVEAPITPLTIAGFQKMGALSMRGAHPFDQDRSGFVLAEGAAIFVLETQAHARQRNQPIYGSILGFGATADGAHLSAPSDDRKAAIQAIQACLNNSTLTPRQVDAIHAHGTGTRLNDSAESDMITRLFPHHPHITSTKGATGHTLGASGALGAAFSLLALRSQLVPPCTGLRVLDPDFCLKVSNQPLPQVLRHVL